MQRPIIATSLVVLLIVIGGGAVAQEHITGYVCSACHTMHNSQGGQPMRFSDIDGPLEEPLPILLRGGCIACHSVFGVSFDSSVALSSAKRGKTFAAQGRMRGTAGPQVMSASPPTYTWGDSAGIAGGTLAGGSFYWVTINDAFGHNVTSIPGVEPDRRLGITPPGGEALAKALQCAGTNGCHGNNTIADQLNSLEKGHHSNVQGVVDGKTVGGSYRFLLGVRGIEDEDWEWTVSATDHNLYAGEDRVAERNPPSAASMSGFCAKCHGDFHNSTSGKSSAGEGGSKGFTSPWLRHPNDYDMAQGGGYDGYTAYDSKAPLARTIGTMSAGSKSSVAANQRIIMCLTCHRAHGSPNYAMLRWNYRAWPGPGGQEGCLLCHTAK